MSKSVCRAITLYSYHIPIRESDLSPQYTTIGFFDGMSTKTIDVKYPEDDLKELWKYTMEQTQQCDGAYSFQNIFVMSDDAWNAGCADADIWDKKTDEKYPLTMVVFLQLKEYLTGRDGIKEQCEAFGSLAREHLKEGIAYVYSSIDKNDFVVCLKCRKYHNAVETIKALHGIDKSVVYSYSVFSVSNAVLQEFSEEKYSYLFNETIESICLKGIANSIRNPEHVLKLDEKYWDFCARLTEKLYGDKKQEENEACEDGTDADDYKTYDILGDNDFRYIARCVKLGKLIREFAPGGMFSYSESNFPFYLFSSSLVLNTQTTGNYERLDIGVIETVSDDMKKQMTTEYCDKVSEILCGKSGSENKSDSNNIFKLIEEKYSEDDKIKSIYYALYQLLQSFKVLEISPAKRYDFFSMFPPFKMIVDIVMEKLEQGVDIGDESQMFDFIHKISMTFHSAQRTDIQFFQIPDFNVIIHYAPAKLRAFYAMWIMNLAELYKSFKEKSDKFYSFIFAPGMFEITFVKQLFLGSRETRRLMLVTLPDRAMYNIKWLTIVLSHEAAHIGCERRREKRHESALKVCARAAVLEMHAFMLSEIQSNNTLLEERVHIDEIRQDRTLLGELEERIMEENQTVLGQFQLKERDDECRRKKSREHIETVFARTLDCYGEKIIADYCCHIKNAYIDSMKGKSNNEDFLTKLSRIFNRQQIELKKFSGILANIQLDKLVKIVYYIEEEAFSDLITILTLEHSMEDYIRSFTFGEITMHDIVGNPEDETEEETEIKEKTQKKADRGAAGMVRRALVIKTMAKIVEHEWADKYVPGLKAKWKEGKLEKLCVDLKDNPLEQYISGQVACYINGLRDVLEDISSYEYMYDDREQGFIKSTYDVLNDRIVWEAMRDYLCECAEGYLMKLTTNDDIYKRKKYVADVYQQLQQGSFLDVLQIVEKFLYKNERDYINQESVHEHEA